MSRFMSRVLQHLLAVVTTLVSATVFAQTDDGAALRGLALSLDLGGLYRLDSDYDRWNNDEVWDAFGLAADYDLWRLGTGTRLSLGLAWLSENLKTRRVMSEMPPPVRAVDDFTGRIANDSLEAAAILRFRADRLLQPYLRLGLGGIRSELTLDQWSANSLEATAYGASARAALGVRVQPRPLRVKGADGRPLLALGPALEVGGRVGTPLDFSDYPLPLARMDPPIPGSGRFLDPVPFGKLGQTAGYAELAVMVVF